MKQNISVLQKKKSSNKSTRKPYAPKRDAHHNFSGFIDGLKSYGTRRALTLRPFIKIESYSYSDVYDLSQQAAHYLDSKGIQKGDRVMVVASNSPEWVILFLGCQLIGATLVPVDARNTLETVTTFSKQTKPALTFRGQHLLPEIAGRKDVLVLEEFLRLIAFFPNTHFASSVTGDETAVIVFTSGTTAAPKGVVLTQKNILANTYGSKRVLDVKKEWRFMSVLPLSHMYELTAGCMVPLASGASIYYLARVTPGAIAKGLKEYKITVMLAVPQLLVLFLDKIRKTATESGQRKSFEGALKISPHLPVAIRRALFSKVHKELGGKLAIIATGGAPIPLEIDKAWEAMGVTTIQGYGLTETSPVLTMNTLNKRFYESQGHVLDNVHLRIGKDNEIQAKGPSIFSHYFENPEATKEAFTDGGWFKTGDIGRIDDGWLHIQGRAKFAIVRSSGLKVFPEDVEVVADRDELFKEICIVGLKVADGEVVHASIISPASDAKIEAAISTINQNLESFQHIDGWSRWDGEAFPRTRLLKIDRKNVQASVNDELRHKANQASAAKEGKVDEVTAIIRQVLDKPRLIIKDSDVLSDIGLDSLRRLAVVSLIEEEMNIGVSEAKITQKTTMSQLRKLIASGTAVEKPTVRPEWTYNPVVRSIGNLVRNVVLSNLVRHYTTTTLTGVENLEGVTSPAIYIFNHVDGLDGPVLYRSLPKKIRNNLAVAIADDIMKQKGWETTGFMARLCFAAFNFSRKEPFTPSLEYVGTLIDRGYNIALAPEGHLSKTGNLEAFKTGVGLLAVELGVPIIPVKTTGLHGVAPLSKRWPQRHADITVTIGAPVQFKASDDYINVTKQLHDILEAL